MPDPIFGFKKEDAYALKRMLESGMNTSGVSNLDYMDSTLLCVATNGIPARNGTTLGKNTVERRYLEISGGGGVDRVITTIANDNTLTAYNLAATAVATGAYILVQRISGCWVVVWEEC